MLLNEDYNIKTGIINGKKMIFIDPETSENTFPIKDEIKNFGAKWLKDFLSFKIMWIEPILKCVYYIATIFTILFSFSFLALGGYGVLMFFLWLILGPIIVRLAYEMTMMFIMIWHNTRDIAENTKKKEATKK